MASTTAVQARRMAIYDVLAPHYDAVTGDCATEAALIRGILQRRHHRVTTLLDVACGTGAITALLAPSYRVSGLDISPGMLAVAREKLPGETPLYLADMTSFQLNATFDAVVCAYQGVNHLLSLPAWESFFGRAYQHLNPGGVFLFDIATIGHLARMAGPQKMVQQFGHNYLLIRVRTTDGSVFEWHLQVFELKQHGRYEMLAQTVKMRSFPVGQIREALLKRFTHIEVIDGEGSRDRIWFACIKPP